MFFFREVVEGWEEFLKKEKMVNISLFITEQERQVKNDVPAINVCGFIKFVHQTLTNLLAIVKQLKT
jgi:hypothetical protein